MSEKKNIDKLFKEQLKNFEVAPNDAVWENIERELHKDKRKRRVIPIWWKIAGVAAALLLLFTVGQKLFDTDDNTIQQDVVDTKDSSNDANDNDNTKSSDLNTAKDLDRTPVVTHDNPNNGDDAIAVDNANNDVTHSKDSNNETTVASSKDKTKTSSFKDKSLIKNKSLKEHAVANQNKKELPKKTKTNVTTTINNATKEKEAVANTSNNPKLKKDIDKDLLEKEKSEIDKLIKDIKSSKETQVTGTNISDKEKTTSEIDTSKTKGAIKEGTDIEKAIAEAEKDNDKTDEPEEPLKRWSVAPNVAPVYFNTLGKGSPIDDQFINNTKEGDINVSYGVKGSYAINKKLKIRAGINKVDLGYTTNNVVAFSRPSSSGNSTRQLQNIKLHDTTTTFISANSISYTTGPEILFTKEQGSIDQQLGFIEVPIEVEYNLIDKKIGVNLIGGFSTLFLSNNEIYSVQNNGDRAFLGEATNINDMSYSANFGVGLNYNISKQLRFNLEPTFKYQINTFNNTSGDFQPFFIGVYTGLSFKF